jgi:hypothetical protein
MICPGIVLVAVQWIDTRLLPLGPHFDVDMKRGRVHNVDNFHSKAKMLYHHRLMHIEGMLEHITINTRPCNNSGFVGPASQPYVPEMGKQTEMSTANCYRSTSPATSGTYGSTASEPRIATCQPRSAECPRQPRSTKDGAGQRGERKYRLPQLGRTGCFGGRLDHLPISTHHCRECM